MTTSSELATSVVHCSMRPSGTIASPIPTPLALGAPLELPPPPLRASGPRRPFEWWPAPPLTTALEAEAEAESLVLVAAVGLAPTAAPHCACAVAVAVAVVGVAAGAADAEEAAAATGEGH